MSGADFVFLDDMLPGLRWDAKYATWDNFTGRPVDGYLVNRVVGTTDLGAALARARQEAAARGFDLLIWDAYRPQQAVDCFVRWSQQAEDGVAEHRHHPNISREEMFTRGYVARRSGHSRGSTVDLTLLHRDTGRLAMMGGGHDLMDPVSHHDAPGVPGLAAANRRHLRAVMEASGFVAYQSEWWHYTLRDEPIPDTTYFDVPISARLPARFPALQDARAG